VAVSPIVGGRAVKGPADRMLERLAGGTRAEHVAGCYEGLIDVLVLDERDMAGDIPLRTRVRPWPTKTLMTEEAAARALAEEVLRSAI
jgi:LPPG:FO 2-phospho-L-lactate transferase